MKARFDYARVGSWPRLLSWEKLAPDIPKLLNAFAGPILVLFSAQYHSQMKTSMVRRAVMPFSDASDLAALIKKGKLTFMAAYLRDLRNPSTSKILESDQGHFFLKFKV